MSERRAAITPRRGRLGLRGTNVCRRRTHVCICDDCDHLLTEHGAPTVAGPWRCGCGCVSDLTTVSAICDLREFESCNLSSYDRWRPTDSGSESHPGDPT